MAIATLFTSSQANAGEVPLSPDAFTAVLAQRLQAALPKRKVEVAGSLRLNVEAAAGSGTTYLNRLFDDCQRDHDACDGLVDDYVAKMAAYHKAPETPVKKSQLRVVVRPSAYVDQYRRSLAGDGEPVAVPLAGDFWIMGALDQPTTIALLNTRMLAKPRLSAEDVIALGEKNMRPALKSQVDDLLKQAGSGIAVIAADPYASSLFAFPDLFAPLAQKVGGDLLVAVPSADTVLVSLGGGADAPKAVARVADKLMASAERPFSDAVFRWSDKGWVEVPVATRRGRRKAEVPGS